MNHEEVLVELDELISTVYQAFKSIGFSNQQSFDVTRQLMYGELRGGKRNHGLDRFTWIVRQKNKTFYLDREVLVESFDSKSNCVILNGNNGLGYSHVYEAIVCGLELLKDRNSIIIGLKNTYPTNCLGDYASIFANQGFASYVGSLSPDKVSFPDHQRAVLPTSGQAFGMPGKPPMILDFSIGAITNGDLNYYKKYQLELPAGACLDKNGRVTCDVNQVVDDHGKIIGSILPRGGDSASFIMAGFGVMLMLTGLEVGIKPNSFGTFLSVRKVSETYHDHWDELLNKLSIDSGVSMIPGHRSDRMAKKILSKRKIIIEEKKWQPLIDASNKYQQKSSIKNIKLITQSITDQLSNNYYLSLDNEIENKYLNFFNKYRK